MSRYPGPLQVLTVAHPSAPTATPGTTSTSTALSAGTGAGGVGEQPHAIAAVVCDGVSTSAESHVASRAASVAAIGAMLKALAASRDVTSVMLAGLADAAKAAAEAKSHGEGSTAASCTYTAAVVV